MTKFDFSNAIKEWEPTGENEYIFKNILTDELKTVEGDSFDDAWKAIYHYEGEGWHKWALVHKKETAESLARMSHNDGLKDVRPEEMSVHYAKRNGQHPQVRIRES